MLDAVPPALPLQTAANGNSKRPAATTSSSGSQCMGTAPTPAAIWWPHGRVPNSAVVANALMPLPGAPSAAAAAAAAVRAVAGCTNGAAVACGAAAGSSQGAAVAAVPTPADSSHQSGVCSALMPQH